VAGSVIGRIPFAPGGAAAELLYIRDCSGTGMVTERRPGDSVAAGAVESSRSGTSTSAEAGRTGLAVLGVPLVCGGSAAGVKPSGPGSNCRHCSPTTSPPCFFGMKRAIRLILQGGFDAASQGSQTL
jgi:hypothetical protein